MSVTVVHPSLNRGGGAERVCLSIVKTLSENGYNVTLATVDRTDWRSLDQRFGESPRPFKEFYVFDAKAVKDTFSQAIFTLSSFIPLLLYVRFKQSSGVVVNTCGEIVDSIADISYINALPMRVTPNYAESGMPNSSLWRLSVQAYGFSLRILDRIYAQNIVLVNSRFMQSIIRRDLKRSSVIVYPPVAAARFGLASDNRTRKNVVATVARIRPGKQLELVPDIAKLTDRKWKFDIVGLADEASGETLKKLLGRIRNLEETERIRLRVNLPSQRLADTLACSKVYLHLQPMEAFGIAIVEAMAAGCVPVVPKNGGPWFDILDRRQGKFGYSYQNVAEAAELLNMIINDDRLRKEVSERAKERAADFDTSFFEKEILEIVDRAAHTKKTCPALTNAKVTRRRASR